MDVTGRVIGAAIQVHRALGPGLLESAYEVCMAAEMAAGGLRFSRQHPISLRYRSEIVECAYRADFLVEEQVIVELKSVAGIDPIHEAQLLSYLRLSGCQLGLLINFNVSVLKAGIRRMILSAPSASSAVRQKKIPAATMNAAGRDPKTQNELVRRD